MSENVPWLPSTRANHPAGGEVLNVTAYAGRFRAKGVRLFSLQVYERVGMSQAGVYINNNFHLARKMLGYISTDIICLPLGTDNVQEQIFEYIFAPNAGYCVYYPSNLLLKHVQF